eukprot:2383561-Lingulodinium_polyedra.AAC.1
MEPLQLDLALRPEWFSDGKALGEFKKIFVKSHGRLWWGGLMAWVAAVHPEHAHGVPPPSAAIGPSGWG